MQRDTAVFYNTLLITLFRHQYDVDVHEYIDNNSPVLKLILKKHHKLDSNGSEECLNICCHQHKLQEKKLRKNITTPFQVEFDFI